MIRTLTILFVASAALVQADPLEEGIGTFRKAYSQWDSALFWNATQEFKDAVAADAESADAHCWLGTAHFHRMLQIQSRPQTAKLKAAAAGDREAAIAALEKAVELDATLAEAHAMLGTLYGMKVDGVMTGMRYGKTIEEHQNLALKHGNKNPRVRYLLGVALLKTAEEDEERLHALRTLNLAQALYEAEARKARGKNEPAWGNDACLAFIGEAYSQLHKDEKAQDYYRKALALRPNNQMAKDGLAKFK